MQPVAEDLVTALLAVDGVAAAAVEPLGDGPGTLRLQMAPGSDEVAVAGAVSLLLRTRFGLAVDADRVQVLDQTGAPAVSARLTPARVVDVRRPDVPALNPFPVLRHARSGTPAAPRAYAAVDTLPEGGPSTSARPDGGSPPQVQVTLAGRLAIARLQLVAAGLGVAVTVTLAHGDVDVRGEAKGSATTSGVHRSVAAATLRAVERAVVGAARFEVEQVEMTQLGAEVIVVVLVTMLTGSATLRLTGASVVREDARQAVIRAVLAAVNRRLEMVLDGQAAVAAEES